MVVVNDLIFSHSFPLFEELVYDCTPDKDLHVMLSSPGGDGEQAVRLVRAAQARCRELTVIVPDQAKSAATLFALGAHHILMGPASDLGPVDSQFMIEGGLIAAKDIIAAVDDAVERVQEAPQTFELYASLLSNVTAVMAQQARAARASDRDLLEEVLRSNPDRSEEVVIELKENLVQPLIERPNTHSALFSVRDAIDAGLPAALADVAGTQWRIIWRLWMKYIAIGQPVYEGERVSHTNIPQVRDYDEPLR